MSEMLLNREITLGAGVSGKLLDKNHQRLFALFINDSDTVVYLRLGQGPASANNGIRLNASGGSYEISTTNPWYGEIHAYCSAAKLILVTEVSV